MAIMPIISGKQLDKSLNKVSCELGGKEMFSVSPLTGESVPLHHGIGTPSG